MSFRRILAAFVFQILLPLYALILLPVQQAYASFPADAISVDFILWWDMPIRAFTGIPISVRPSFFEIDNRPVVWSMTGAPSGMTIDATTGLISWASPTAGTTTGIVVTITRASCNSTNYPSCSLTASRTFTLTVGTSDFRFVDPAGTDGSSCGTTTGNACQTLKYTLDNRLPAGTDGVTVYMRGGAYSNSWTNGFVGYFANAYPISDYMEIAPYPGETPVLDATGGEGLWIEGGQYTIIRGITTKNGTTGPNLVLRGTHIIGKDLISFGAAYDTANNVHNIEINGSDVLVNRAVGYGAAVGTGVQTQNVTNFELYNETGSTGTSYALNIKSYNTFVGIKKKHSNAEGVANFVLQNFEEFGSDSVRGGFAGFGKNDAIRYGVFYKDARSALALGTSDPGSANVHVLDGMLVDHVTIVQAATSNAAVAIQVGYGTEGTPPVTLRHMLVEELGGDCSGGSVDNQNTRAMLAAWYDNAPSTVSKAYPFDSDYNIWYNSASTSGPCFYIGNDGSPNGLALSVWKALTATSPTRTRDTHSINLIPGLTNSAAGDLTITTLSNAATQCGSTGDYGDFCGAFKPGRTDYGTVGIANTTRLNYDGTEGSATPTPTPTPTPSGGGIFSYLQ